MNYTKYTFFYKAKNPFSNWYPCRFKDLHNIEYTSTEQYMMAEKAKLFGDEEIRKKILLASHPKEQKELGRLVNNFDSTIWNQHCQDIVYKGCYLKFTQNLGILETLLSTKGTLLVEASPYDKIWGIGLAEDDPRIRDPKNWKGTNLLGIVLTRLRDDILNTRG